MMTLRIGISIYTIIFALNSVKKNIKEYAANIKFYNLKSWNLFNIMYF